MRLLVLDEAWQAVGGVDTLRCFLLPALAGQVDALWWMSPAHVHLRRLEDLDVRRVSILDLRPPSRSVRGLALAAARRLPRRAERLGTCLIESLCRQHLRRVCETLKVTHVLEICVFRRPVPDLDLPRAGIVHDLDYPDRGGSPIDEIFRGWLRTSTRLFADSTQTRAELLHLLPAAASRVDVLPLAPTSPPTNLPERHQTRWARHVPVLYCPCGGSMRKGQETLFAALRQLEARGVPFHCYCSGVGTDALGRTNRVTGLGWQPWSVVEELYRAADVVVLPSRREGFGLPLGEALRRDRPVVATRLAPFAEQVAFFGADACVRWVSPGDDLDLAEALAGILSGTRPFPAFTAPLRARLAAWTWDAYAARLVGTLRHATS